MERVGLTLTIEIESALVVDEHDGAARVVRVLQPAYRPADAQHARAQPQQRRRDPVRRRVLYEIVVRKTYIEWLHICIY